MIDIIRKKQLYLYINDVKVPVEDIDIKVQQTMPDVILDISGRQLGKKHKMMECITVNCRIEKVNIVTLLEMYSHAITRKPKRKSKKK